MEKLKLNNTNPEFSLEVDEYATIQYVSIYEKMFRTYYLRQCTKRLLF